MLRKLLKYEAKATARSFLGMYLALFLLSIALGVASFFEKNVTVNGLSVNFGSSAFMPGELLASAMVIGVVTYAAIAVAVFVCLFVNVADRFYKNLFTNEGYLMHTLPVTTWQLIASKALMASIWAIASIAAMAVSFFIMLVLFSRGAIPWPHISWAMCVKSVPFGLMMLVETVEQWFLLVSSVYLSIVIANQFKKARMVWGVVTFFILRTLESVLLFVVLFGNITADGAFVVRFLVQGVLMVVYFVATNYLLAHRLNLD